MRGRPRPSTRRIRQRAATLTSVHVLRGRRNARPLEASSLSRPLEGATPARPRTGAVKAELSARDRVLKTATWTTCNRRASDRFQRLPSERSCSSTGFQHAIRGQQGRVQLRPICRPAKRSALLVQSHGCLDRLPQRRKIMIASHRLASTWSRRASTQCRESSWVAERDLIKVRLKSGTYSGLRQDGAAGTWPARANALSVFDDLGCVLTAHEGS